MRMCAYIRTAKWILHFIYMHNSDHIRKRKFVSDINHPVPDSPQNQPLTQLYYLVRERKKKKRYLKANLNPRYIIWGNIFAQVTTQLRLIGVSTHSLNSFRYRKQCHFSSQEYTQHRSLPKHEKLFYSMCSRLVFWVALEVWVLKHTNTISYERSVLIYEGKSRDGFRAMLFISLFKKALMVRLFFNILS